MLSRYIYIITTNIKLVDPRVCHASWDIRSRVFSKVSLAKGTMYSYDAGRKTRTKSGQKLTLAIR